MREYMYDDIEIGTTESFTTTLTSHMMDSFCEITGDTNPLHRDETYCQEQGFDGLVVYGLLTSSFYSTLAGVYLPGKASLLLSVNVKMLNPVFVGDTLTITGTVTEKNDAFDVITVKAMICNEKKKKVSRARLMIKVR